MNILIIDTSDTNSFIALFTHAGKEVQRLAADRKQSQSLLPTLIELLQKNNLRPTQLDAISIGNGPGSFTGTRIGVMAAKTLAYASKCPLISFCSLSKYIPNEEGEFFVVSDGKRHGYYVLQGKRIGASCTYHSMPSLIPKDNLPDGFHCITGDENIPLLDKAQLDPTHLYESAILAVRRKRFADPLRLSVTYLISP